MFEWYVRACMRVGVCMGRHAYEGVDCDLWKIHNIATDSSSRIVFVKVARRAQRKIRALCMKCSIMTCCCSSCWFDLSCLRKRVYMIFTIGTLMFLSWFKFVMSALARV